MPEKQKNNEFCIIHAHRVRVSCFRTVRDFLSGNAFEFAVICTKCRIFAALQSLPCDHPPYLGNSAARAKALERAGFSVADRAIV